MAKRYLVIVLEILMLLLTCIALKHAMVLYNTVNYFERLN